MGRRGPGEVQCVEESRIRGGQGAGPGRVHSEFIYVLPGPHSGIGAFDAPRGCLAPA